MFTVDYQEMLLSEQLIPFDGSVLHVIVRQVSNRKTCSLRRCCMKLLFYEIIVNILVGWSWAADCTSHFQSAFLQMYTETGRNSET